MRNFIWHFLCLAAAIFWLYAGALHFFDPQWFEPIVPPIPGPSRLWVYISGAAELVLGVGFILPSLRKVTGLGSAIFLICVYPANIYMWMYDLELGDGSSLTAEGHFIRLLLQVFGVLLSLWLWRFRKSEDF
jgi:uncharacterized membrane protein